MTPSPWDRLPHPNPLGHVPRHNRTPYRIEAFEQAANADPAPRPELGAELRARREYWRNYVSTPSRLASLLGFAAGEKSRGPTGATLLWVAMIFALTAVSAAYFLSAASLWWLALVVIVPVAAHANWQEGKRIPARRALFHAECPQCRYELSGTDALDAGHMAGEHSGPRRCPECGTPWPLIPPPCPR